MADSRRLAALKQLQTQLRAIDGSGSYHYTVLSASVVLDPIAIDTVASSKTPFLVVLGFEPEQRTWLAGGGRGRLEDHLNGSIVGRVDAADDQDGSKITAFENLVADLELAVTADITLGGLATDIKLAQPETAALGLGNQRIVLVVQPFKVLLNGRAYGAP